MRYNTTPEQFDNIRFENVIQSKYCHELAVFKEKILFDYTEEFLKRYYKRKESKERIPKFTLYYKNYFLFFYQSTFTELIEMISCNRMEKRKLSCSITKL